MKIRFRTAFTLSLAVLSILTAAVMAWFIFRLEKIIAAKLEPNVVMKNFSVSLLNQAFVAEGVSVMADAASPCAGKTLFEVNRATGRFTWRERKIYFIQLDKPTIYDEAFNINCLLPHSKKPGFRLGEELDATGLKVIVRDAQVTLRFVKPIKVNGLFTLKYRETGEPVFLGEALRIENEQGWLSSNRIELLFEKEKGSVGLREGVIKAEVDIPHIEDIPQMSTKKIAVKTGRGNLKLTANIDNYRWVIFSKVDLFKLKLSGKPIYETMFLKLTPQNLWPMVEDKPNFFTVAFKTTGSWKGLPRRYAADFKRAVVKKVKANLKKKIPALPF